MMAQRVTTALVTDHSRALVVMVPTGLMFSVAVILVALRLYVRVKVVRKLGTDDMFIVLGMVGADVLH